MATVEASREAEGLPVEVRRTLTGGAIAMFVDSWDVYLPAFILPAAMEYFEPASLSTATKATLTTLIFTVGLLGRPLGSPIFGSLADTIGRKRTAMISGAGFTILTLLMGLLPGHAQWGLASIGAMLVMRLLVGMFVSGGYAAPIPLALERSPKAMRGLMGGLIAAPAAIAVLAMNLTQSLTIGSMPHDAFLRWGWRIPFMLGVLFGIVYLVYYSRIPEADMKTIRAGAKGKRPLAEVFSRENLRSTGQVLLLTTGFWLAAQLMVSFLPTLLIQVLGQPALKVSWFLVASHTLQIAAMILFGLLSQRTGRRKLMVWMGAWIVVIVTPALFAMIELASRGAPFALVAALAFLATMLTAAPLSVFIVYLNERFPARVRSTGFAVSYTAGLVIPGLYSFWLLGLSYVMPYRYTGLVLIALGGVLVFLAARLGPETREAEMT
jgi:MFS family permease